MANFVASGITFNTTNGSKTVTLTLDDLPPALAASIVALLPPTKEATG